MNFFRDTYFFSKTYYGMVVRAWLRHNKI